MSAESGNSAKVTLALLREKPTRGEPMVMITAYEDPTVSAIRDRQIRW